MASYAEIASHRTAPHDYFQVSNEHVAHYTKPPNEQRFADVVSVDTQPANDELENLSSACQRLWALDHNRLSPGQDFEVNVGDAHPREDFKGNSLFGHIKRDAFNKPTLRRFYCLLNDYNPDETVQERETTEKRHDQVAFIEEIYRTAPIQYLHKLLAAKGHVSRDASQFKSTLQSLWFQLYNRGGGRLSSSAFEHIFVGEIKRTGEAKEVSGFHNWIHFYFEEAKGTLVYEGIVLPRHRHFDRPDSHSQFLTVKFEWNGVLKRDSSIFVGSSPEFEIALYTLCFFEGGEDNYVQLGPYQVNIKVYHLGPHKIGSAFTSVE